MEREETPWPDTTIPEASLTWWQAAIFALAYGAAFVFVGLGLAGVIG